MKYESVDQLDDFEFHDSVWTLDHRKGDSVTFRVAHLNIHEDMPLNPEDTDMELETAMMTFSGFRLIHVEPGRAWTTDENGNSVPKGSRVLFTGEEGMAFLAREEFQVFHFERLEDHWEIGCCGAEPYFTVELEFDSVRICWDGYRKMAWYELHHSYKHEANLETPVGMQHVKLGVTVHREDAVDYQKNIHKAPCASANVTYQGKTYVGWGEDDYLWIDAIAALQDQLPKGVTIRGCITCRHGNLCPVGDLPDEVFCTKDLVITQKSDLYFCTEDPDEREKRSRRYFQTCEDWKPQSKDHYTYNDYLDHLDQTDL